MTDHLIDLGGITMPLTAVTETYVIVGKRESGKTSTAKAMAEGMLSHNQQIVVLDPTGAWWGLRSSADGKSDGYPVVIFGGRHADVPLEETAGVVIAEVLMGRKISAVLDLSRLPSKAARRRFAADFLEKLYDDNTDPLHLIVDEADLFAPQRVYAGMERLMGAMDDVVRRGRLHGLGVTLITQRPAVLNKDVMSQVETLVALRLTGAQDLDAIDAWIGQNANSPEQAREVKRSLPQLPTGTGWFWSPQFLKVLEKVKVRKIYTFDSSATPKVGVKVKVPERVTPIDLAALGEQIAATVERVNSENPEVLKTRIKRLEKLLEQERAKTPEPVTETVEVPVLDKDSIDLLEKFAATASTLSEMATTLQEDFDNTSSVVLSAINQHRLSEQRPPQPTVMRSRAHDAPKNSPDARTTPPRRLRAVPSSTESDVKLTGPQTKILTTLAQHQDRETLDSIQVAVLAGYSHRSGSFRNSLASLRSAGYAEGYGTLKITETGLSALGSYEDLPRGDELLIWWKNHSAISGPAGRILDVLAQAYPQEVDISEIAAALDYSPTSGSFRNSLARLRSLRLAHTRRPGTLVLDANLA